MKWTFAYTPSRMQDGGAVSGCIPLLLLPSTPRIEGWKIRQPCQPNYFAYSRARLVTVCLVDWPLHGLNKSLLQHDGIHEGTSEMQVAWWPAVAAPPSHLWLMNATFSLLPRRTYTKERWNL